MERLHESTDQDIQLRFRRYQFSGIFHHSFSLQDFPLDHQEFKIQVGAIQPSSKVRLSFDPRMFKGTINSAPTKNVHTADWSLTQDPYSTVENLVTSTFQGDPTLTQSEPYKFKSLHFWIPMKRGLLSQFYVVILPLLAIGLVAILLLFVPNPSFEKVGDVSVGVFLSIITYSIAYTQLTPTSGVFTKADQLYCGTFIAVITAFTWVILSNIIYSKEQLRDHGVGKRFKAIRIFLLLTYGVSVVTIPIL